MWASYGTSQHVISFDSQQRNIETMLIIVIKSNEKLIKFLKQFLDFNVFGHSVVLLTWTFHNSLSQNFVPVERYVGEAVAFDWESQELPVNSGHLCSMDRVTREPTKSPMMDSIWKAGPCTFPVRKNTSLKLLLHQLRFTGDIEAIKTCIICQAMQKKTTETGAVKEVSKAKLKFHINGQHQKEPIKIHRLPRRVSFRFEYVKLTAVPE